MKNGDIVDSQNLSINALPVSENDVKRKNRPMNILYGNRILQEKSRNTL